MVSAGEMVRSYLFLAKYELEGGDATLERSRGGDDDGGMEDRMMRGEANWGLAAQYLNQIVTHVSLVIFGPDGSSVCRC